jgi:hypothetical protein
MTIIMEAITHERTGGDSTTLGDDQRGVVVLEGLSMVVLLVVLWGATQYIQNLYGDKWATLWQSRSGAWAEAMSCGNDTAADLTGLYGTIADDRAPDPCPDTNRNCTPPVDGVSTASSTPAGQPGWFAASSVAVPKTLTWTHPVTHTQYTFTSTFQVTCNEPRARAPENYLRIRNVNAGALASKSFSSMVDPKDFLP